MWYLDGWGTSVSLCPLSVHAGTNYLIPDNPGLSPRLPRSVQHMHTRYHQWLLSLSLSPLLGCGCVPSLYLLLCVLSSSCPFLFCPMRCCSASHRATTCSGSMDRSFTVHLVFFYFIPPNSWEAVQQIELLSTSSSNLMNMEQDCFHADRYYG